MQSCNSVTTPTELGLKLEKNPIGKKIDNTLFKQLVGCLMYLTITKPDIMYSKFNIFNHLLAAKIILRYLQGTTDLPSFLYRIP